MCYSHGCFSSCAWGATTVGVAFIGYLVAGPGGAVAAGIGVFLPVYLFVVIPYPWFDKWSAP